MKRYLVTLLYLLGFALFSGLYPLNYTIPKSHKDLSRAGKDFALFFALEDYDYWKDLRHPIDEARSLASELSTSYAFQTEVLSNPTKQEIFAKLQEYRKKTYAKDAQLLIFFSGHGEFIESTGEGFFIPKKGRLDDFMQESYIPHSRLKSWVNNIPCKHILLAIDACYSGAIDDRISGNRGPGKRPSYPNNQIQIQRFLQENLRYQSRFYLTSGGLEKTPDRSQFARQFLGALRSTSNQHPILTFAGLQSFLESANPRPRAGQFGKNEPGLNNFIFLRKINKTGPIPQNAKADLQAWQKAKNQNTLIAYKSYLKKYPRGEFSSLAQRKILQLSEAVDYADWETAKRGGTKDDFEAYKQKHPEGLFIDLANDEIEKLSPEGAGQLLKTLIDTPRVYFMMGGTFDMGSEEGATNEKPLHRVTVSDFYLAEAETTNEQFCYFLNEMGNQKEGGTTWLELGSPYCQVEQNDGRFQPKSGKSQHPVVEVSWYGAVAFCQWLSQKTGLKYRLPTEAEWEYAAGGGPWSRTRYAGTDSKSSLLKYAVYATKSPNSVKSKNPLVMGNVKLYDLSGNVYEWCSDWKDKDYYKNSTFKDPLGPTEGLHKVLRGGSWDSDATDCRTSARGGDNPSYRSYLYGFRIARTP